MKLLRSLATARSRQLALGASVAVLTLSLAAPGYAAGPHRVGDSYLLYISADHTNAVLVGAPVKTAAAKHLRNAEADALRAGVLLTAQPLANFSMGDGGCRVGPDGGGCSIYNYFSTSISTNGNPCPWNQPCTATLGGASHGRWHGCFPSCNADSQVLRETIKEDGFGISVSVPGGAGFSGSGDTASWSNTYGPGWTVDHYWSNLVFTTWSAYTGWEQWGAYDATFGGSTYTANSYNGYWCGC